MMDEISEDEPLDKLFQKFKELILRVSKPVSIALETPNDTSENVRRQSLVFAFHNFLNLLLQLPSRGSLACHPSQTLRQSYLAEEACPNSCSQIHEAKYMISVRSKWLHSLQHWELWDSNDEL